MDQSTRLCVVCSASISHLRSIAKYCSRGCIEAARSARDPQRRTRGIMQAKALAAAARPARPCASSSCGSIIPANAAPDRLYCTTACRDSRYRAEVRSVKYAPGTDRHARHREASRAWKSAHPVENRLSKALRDARKRGTSVAAITTQQVMARFAVFGYRCWMCGAPWEQIDHVKPLSKGGPHILANLRPACARCNRSKNDSWPFAGIR